MLGPDGAPHIGRIPDIHPRTLRCPRAGLTIGGLMSPSAVARPVALLEREQEVERIHAVLHAAGRRGGGALIIEGAPGIGKSRLLGEAREEAPRLGLRVLAARATQLEQGFPFGVVRQLFERALLDADDAERERWLAGAAALASELLTGAALAPAAANLSPIDPGYAWQHGLYWLASNIAADTPLALVVDDLQWCDAPSARALAFMARRVEGQPVALILATRPPDPAETPEAAVLVADPIVELVSPEPLSPSGVEALVAARLAEEPDGGFIGACVEVTGGNPFLLGELLEEAAANSLKPTAATAPAVATLVPRGVANAVLLRLSRLAPEAGALARALSALGDGAQVGDAGLLARLTGAETEAAMAALVAAGVVEAGRTVRFLHPILGTAIYGDLSPAERERLHHGAATILRDRGAPAGVVAAQVMHTEPAGDPEAVALLRQAAREALALGDAAGAAALLERALEEPPAEDERPELLVELGRAYARAGAREGIAALSEIVEQGERSADIAAAAIELSGMLFFTGQAGDAGTILFRARDRLPVEDPARARLEVALLGVCCTSAAVRAESDAMMAELCSRSVTAEGPLGAARLATLAMDEAVHPHSADAAAELAERALATGLPREPHRAWSLLCLIVLTVADRFDVAQQHADELLADARRRGAGLTVAAVSAHRAFVLTRRGDLTAARGDAEAAIELTSDVVGSEFVSVMAVPTAVLAGLDRGETHDSLRRMIDRAGVGFDIELPASSHLRYASGVLHAAAGEHAAAVEELRTCASGHPMFGGENPAVVPWRSAAALSLSELGHRAEARSLAAEELRRARAFGAPRAIGVALRALALVGPREERSQRLELALDVLAESPARLERARVLLDIGATRRAAGQRSAAKEPLLEALALTARCGACALEQRARAELAAIGVRPRTTDRTGVDSLTPSERRVVELAAEGGTNREIAQTLFVTEKTIETHLGRAFRKLDVSSRRQLSDVLARAAG